MGGRNRESNLAAQKRRQERLDALRTRGGVVDLVEWRIALRAVAGLERLLCDPPWLLGVRLAPAREVGFELVVTLLRDTQQARMCLPSHVNEIPVRIVVRNAAAGRLARDS